MKILITCHSSRHGGGVSVAQNLLRVFGEKAPEHHYFVTIPPDLGYEAYCSEMPNIQVLKYETTDLLSRWVWEHFALQKVVHEFQPDLILNMANRGFTNPDCPQATFIQQPHLIYPTKYFGKVSLKERTIFYYHRWHLRKSLKKTQLLLCQTPVTKVRLRNEYGDGFKLFICSSTTPIEKTNEVCGKPKLLVPHKDKYLLFYPTRYYPHKNIEVVIELFRRYRKELVDVAVVLTIAPDQHSRVRAIIDDVERYDLSENIIIVGQLTLEEVACYYKHVDALFFPSLLETFGLPNLEAMHFRCPILGSDLDFERGVCGDAALYFNPWDVNDICDKILMLKNDPDLQCSLVENGMMQQAKQPSSWDEIGTNVIRKLESLIA